MTPVTRRKALQLGGGIALGGIAGCAMADSSEEVPEGRLVELYALNLDDQPHTVNVLLQRSGEPVYIESMHAAAFDTTANKAGGGAFDGYPTTEGNYAVYAWYDDQLTTEWEHYAFTSPGKTAGDGKQCLQIHLKLGDRHDQSAPPLLSIFTAHSC